MSAEKVTLHFNSIEDNSENQDIIINAPIKIYASVDNVQALELLNVPEDEDVVVHVRNVINSDTRQKSAFYMHLAESNTWTEVLLGGHSHNNKELLDQLGDINVEDLADKNKILTIKAVDMDGQPENYAFKYKLEWADYPTQLPEIPEDMLNTPAYLTVENGEYVWKNQLVPAQTFQYKQVIIESNEPVKQFKVKDLNYNKDYDEVLIFDGPNLLTDCQVSVHYESESGEKYALVEITSDNENLIFENGEKLTLLVIKNGVSGFLSQLADEYMKKSDVIDLLSGKSITLHKYATKDDLKTKADAVHHHSQYSLDGHNHDERYAMFNHIHSQYITRSDVYASISSVLANLLDIEDPNITIDNINDTLGQSLVALKDELLNEIATLASIQYVDDQIATLKRDFLDADHINIKIGNRNYVLTDYISMLENSISSVYNKTTDVTVAANIRVQLGEDESIGGFNDGDVISTNSSIHEVISKLVTKRIPPVLFQPTVSLTVDPGTNARMEVGERLTLKITASFTQNDAGQATRIRLIASKDGNVNTYELRNNSPFDLYEILSDISPLTLQVVVDYAQGPSKTDNLGRSDYFIPEGQIGVSKVITGKRKSFIGKYLPNSGYRASTIIDTPISKFTMEVQGYEGLHDIIMAFPENQNIAVDSIYYRNQGCDVTDLFTIERNVMIHGANNYTPIEYDVYRLTMPEDLDQKMFFDVSIRRGDQ